MSLDLQKKRKINKSIKIKRNFLGPRCKVLYPHHHTAPGLWAPQAAWCLSSFSVSITTALVEPGLQVFIKTTGEWLASLSVKHCVDCSWFGSSSLVGFVFENHVLQLPLATGKIRIVQTEKTDLLLPFQWIGQSHETYKHLNMGR